MQEKKTYGIVDYKAPIPPFRANVDLINQYLKSDPCIHNPAGHPAVVNPFPILIDMTATPWQNDSIVCKSVALFESCHSDLRKPTPFSVRSVALFLSPAIEAEPVA